MYFEKHQKCIKDVLFALNKHPLHYKEIMRIWIESGSTTVQLSKAMKWMKEKGYLKKSDVTNRRSAYEITDVGKKYLEGLQA